MMRPLCPDEEGNGLPGARLCLGCITSGIYDSLGTGLDIFQASNQPTLSSFEISEIVQLLFKLSDISAKTLTFQVTFGNHLGFPAIPANFAFQFRETVW